jgi:AraC-like DNA-binding protein
VLELHGVRIDNPDPIDPHVSKATRTMANWTWNTSLDRERLATAVGVSPSHLDRLFRHCLGETPRAYWDRIRIEHACRRLLQPGTRVQEVAHELGFRSPAYFSTWCRKHMSCSPRGFVKAHGT